MQGRGKGLAPNWLIDLVFFYPCSSVSSVVKL
jgi:hypothetical protein